MYIFTGQAGDLNLNYKVYDIDHVYEVDIILNNTQLHDVEKTDNNKWSSRRTLVLPDALVNDAGINVLIFDSSRNPPKEWYWGVRNVSVERRSNSTTAISVAHFVKISGNLIQGVEHLLDGRSAPPLRLNGDDADSNAVYFDVVWACIYLLNITVSFFEFKYHP